MSDTLTQPEMKRLYERGCKTVLTYEDDGTEYMWSPPLTPTALMLGACHDLAWEVYGDWTRVHYYQVSDTRWDTSVKLSKVNTPCEVAWSPTALLHALVSLWHKMKDEQEKIGGMTYKEQQDILREHEKQVDRKFRETVTQSEPEKVDTEQESVAILVAAQAKRIAQLQSDVAKLAEVVSSRILFVIPELQDIITRNRKES